MLRNMTSIYIIHENKILLLYRIGSRVVSPCWCGIGGHFEKEELNDPKACAIRELYEETGIGIDDITDLKLKYITLRHVNNEIRQNYYFFTKLINTHISLKECDEGNLEWVDINDVLKLDMPYTSKYCLSHYLQSDSTDENIFCGVATEEGVDWSKLHYF